MFRKLLACAVLCLPTAALSQEVSVNSVGCSNILTLPNGQRTFNGQVLAGVQDWHALLDVKQGFQILNRAREEGYVRCGQQPPPYMTVFISAANGYGGAILSALWNNGARTWQVTSNRVPELLSAERQQAVRQAEQERQRSEEATRLASTKAEHKRLQDEFAKTNGIQAWVNWKDLAANPFPWQGKVVGIRQDFLRMLSSSEALMNGGIVITSVPSSLFRREGEPYFLAIKVEGIKQVRSPIGTLVNVAYGSYVGSHRCVDARCSDFVDQ